KYTPTDEEVKQLISFYNNKTYMNCRNRTIIITFTELGLRCSELIQLKYDDVDLDNNIITVRRKGNIEQQLPISKELKLQLVKYMNRYVDKLDGGLLFVSKNGNELTIPNVHYMLKKCNGNISPHSLRRYACTKMLKQGIPIVFVSRFMNHSSIEVTNSYYADIKATDIKF
ncbi:MAG: site-specific integrase, partial [Romboutsia timonensis]|uniref:tyrosine-type recombinase/integrase n=1 Tax=Romboutsia timonensis TaxID=1776391 RepID=UPI002A761042